MDIPVNNNSNNSHQEQQLERRTSVEEQKDEPVKLTPEQEEELKLRSKYPNPQKPGGSAFIQKMLHRGNKKYFDSGDYNMAKSKNRALNNTNRQQQQQSTQIQVNVENNNNPDVDISSPTTTTTSSSSNAEQQINDSNNKLNIINEDTLNNSTTSVNNQINYSCQSPVIINNNNSNNNSLNISNSASLQSSPSIQNNNHHQYHHHLSTSNQASPVTMTSVGLTTSISSSSLSMHLNPSVSLDKLSNINPILDSEEIGHGIPTPECLPQSRKHSIAQSKLATPRVSSS